MSFKILRAKTEDRYDIQNINIICLPENYDISIWNHCLSFDTSFIAKSGDKIVAYVLCGDNYDIYSIAVLPEYQNKGAGKLLLLHVLKDVRSRNMERIILQVRISNPAIRLYEKVGFTKDKILPKYYKDGEDGWKMVYKNDLFKRRDVKTNLFDLEDDFLLS